MKVILSLKNWHYGNTANTWGFIIQCLPGRYKCSYEDMSRAFAAGGTLEINFDSKETAEKFISAIAVGGSNVININTKGQF